MANLYETANRWMTERKIGFIDLMLPFYISAACCHIINLENKKREFYFEHGQPADMRLHMFITAPPGYMKSFVLKRFLDRQNSLFGQTAIKTAFMGQVTEAGFVGTIQSVDGESVQQPGMAYDFMDHILGIEEFSALTNTMTSDHSKNLDNALLTALDSGYLIKRLAAGELRYETHLTLWAGSQPARFNLSSGLGRRFGFIYFVPTAKQQLQMRQFRREGKGIMGSKATADSVYHLTEKFTSDAQKIKEISFADSIYTGLDAMEVPHYEEPLYEKIALGYNLATQPITPSFTVRLSDAIKRIWQLENEWRFKIKSGALESQVMQFIIESPGIEENVLKTKLIDFGMSFAETSALIDTLYKQRRIGIINDSKDKHARKRYLWPMS